MTMYKPTSPPVGSITCILGPMFSGKTTEMLRLHDRQMIARRNCVLVKYAKDTRYDSELVATHAKVTGSGRTVKAVLLADVYDTLFDNAVQVVSIDEGQFFDDLSETCDALARRGKVVIVAALSGTFDRKAFSEVAKLIPLCDEIKQVKAVCTGCGNDASFTFRSTLDDEVEIIGGQDTYQALCRKCYDKGSRIRNTKENCEAVDEPIVTKAARDTIKRDGEILDSVPRKVLCALP